MAIKEYFDIGHDEPDDIIWLLRDSGLEAVQRVTSDAQEPWTHFKRWGSEAQDHWKGRYEPKTGFCSIAPPAASQVVRPPADLLKTLRSRLIVTKFYYFFAGGVVAISPHGKGK